MATTESKSWGQRLDDLCGGLEREVVLPQLGPPERDALATAYPKNVTSPWYWGCLIAAMALAAIGASFS